MGHRAGAYGYVVAFREHPPVKVRRHVVTDVHFSQILVVNHFVVRDFNSLLKGNRVVVITGADELRHPRVGTVSADDGVHLQRAPLAHSTGLAVVAGVVEDVRGGGAFGGVHLKEETVDDGGSGGGSALPQIGIEDFAANHSDVLVGLQRLADVDGDIRGRDHLHLGDTPVDDVQRKIELSDHAQRYGAATRLAVVELPLYQERLDAALGQCLSSRPSGGTTSDDSDSKIPASDLGAELTSNNAETPGSGLSRKMLDGENMAGIVSVR